MAAIGEVVPELALALEEARELGDDVEAIRLVLVPLAWQPLSAGNARKLRDVLARVLPGGDLAATVKELCAVCHE